MSEYLEFYARKDNTFIELDCFSRNSKHFQLFLNKPQYGNIKILSEGEIDSVITNINTEIATVKKAIKDGKKFVKKISFNPYDNDDIAATYSDALGQLSDFKEELKELKAARKFYEVLCDMINNGKYCNKKISYYVGLETGDNPTVKDIEI
jgi:hypothetical protein